MDRAVKSWFSQTTVPAEQDLITNLTKRLSKSYTIYGSLLLLPPTALTGPEWTDLNNAEQLTLENLYAQIAHHLKITHIALNKPIPLHLSDSQEEEAKQENILRSPLNFTPLYGDFGPSTCTSPHPTSQDFDQAFWVTAKQNGIYQTWAPRWTMFSRGNISEKARILELESVSKCVEEGDSMAVDLFAGIGYFAFSYRKAGVRCVLGWELNGWSVEGLQRGARKNGWGLKVVEAGADCEGELDELTVFHENNENAPQRIRRLRKKGKIPPVRHVNCGMLPSSRKALELAAEVLDGSMAGWVHVHENFLVEEIDVKAQEVSRELESLLVAKRGCEVKVEVEYVNRLKSYSPGVMHCVIDIAVYPADLT